MITYADLVSQSIVAFAEDLESGQKFTLETKKDSYCLFFDQFRCGVFIIQLRLDWHDLDQKGNPTLDADFYNERHEPIKKMNGIKIHHTNAETGNERVYAWELFDTKMRIRVTLILKANIAEAGNATDSQDAIVIKS
jgi:hypothetical protein